MPTAELKREVKQLLIEALQISDIEPDDIDDSIPIFENEKLGLDSVDALEIVVALQREFRVRIDSQNLARSVLHTVDSIAEFVESKRGK